MSENILMVLNLLCGVALFLYGMSAMGDGLKKVAGNQLELILYKLTNSPLKGFLLGTGVTAVIQSSSATTVMVVGFVNSGMMKVSQAVGVILGANIGTSITGWIICLSYIGSGGGIASLFSSKTITAVAAIIGILLKMLAKKDSLKQVGMIMLGFAVLMTGMSTMSAAVSPLKTNPAFIGIMTTLRNPILGVLFGIAFAAVLQSASAAVGVLQALSTTGAITFAAAFPMVLGIAVGASFPVLLAALGANKNGQRTAFLYLVIAVISMFLGLFLYPAEMLAHLPLNNMQMDPFNIAFINSAFRIVTMILMLPFCKQLEKLIFKLIPSSEEENEDKPEFDLLEERFLDNPTVAYEQSMLVMESMAHYTEKSVRRAMSLLEKFDPKTFKKVEDAESNINKYENKLGSYLMKQTNNGVSTEQGKTISKALQAISDYESISDYALSIAEVCKDMDSKKLSFSLAATDEIYVVASAIEEMMEITVKGFIQNDSKAIKRVIPLKELVDMNCNEIKKRHVLRLKKGECQLEQGMELNDLLNDFQHIADHCANLALDIIKMAEQDFDTHRFLRRYTSETKNEYGDLLHKYEVKYGI